MPPPEPKDAARVIREIARFLSAYEPPIGEMPGERQPIAHVIWGWWMWMTEQAMLLAEAKRPARIAALSPVVRSVGEHADLMLWLHAVGPAGIDALHASAIRSQQSLWDSYKAKTGEAPEGIDRPEGAPEPIDDEERQTRRTLYSVEQRMGMFEDGVPYYIYRLLSGLVHGGIMTSSVYAPVRLDGLGEARHEPEPDAVSGLVQASVVDCAIRCCQAAVIFRDEVHDSASGLGERVLHWTSTLGIDDQLPDMRSSAGAGLPSRTDVANAAHQLLESDMSAATHRLQSLSQGEVEDDSELVAVMKAIKRLRSAATALTAT